MISGSEPARRVVTGVDAQGRSRIESDQPLTPAAAGGRPISTDFWVVRRLPTTVNGCNRSHADVARGLLISATHDAQSRRCATGYRLASLLGFMADVGPLRCRSPFAGNRTSPIRYSISVKNAT